mgnify:CR=1 FL=1
MLTMILHVHIVGDEGVESPRVFRRYNIVNLEITNERDEIFITI